MKKNLLLAFIAAAALALLAAVVAFAQEGQPNPVSDDQVNAVAKKLYCPVCPNTPLDVCETKACQDWRAQIRQELGSGWTEQQITAYFVQQYGERVLGEPERKGFTSMVWVLPVLGVLVGGSVVFQIVRSWKRGSQRLDEKPATQNPARLSEEALARVEKALKELD